jgi:predicted Zn finger-like uncharacterized protein
MIIVCPSCQAKYKFDETKLGDRPRARTRCSKCNGTIEIENPAFGTMTLPPADVEPLSGLAPSPEPAEHPTSPGMPAPATEERLKTQRHLGIVAEDDSGGQTITGQDLHKMGVLELPRDRRFSLAVIQGPATGQIFQVTKTRTTMGRTGCDINLNDPEASRQHAVLEIFGERVVLRDLGSTNGTFVDSEKIQQSELANHGEFRIGGHVLMLIVTEVE